MKIDFGVLLLMAACCATASTSYAGSTTETFSITSPIQLLGDTDLGPQPTASSTPDVYTSGKLDPGKALTLLNTLKVPTDEPVIIHFMRWGDKQHKTVMFQKWYLYNAAMPDGGFYLRSQEQRFEDTDLPGAQQFRVLFIHLNFDLFNNSESINVPADGSPPALVFPVSYTIAITKQDTQFIQDLKTLLQVEGITGTKAAAAGMRLGYYAYGSVISQFSTSTVTITPSLTQSPPTVGNSSATKAASTLSPATYTNEGPTYWGLSAAIPVTSYKDVTYDSTGGQLTPKTTTKQNAYVALDAYLPAALPALMSVRYIPHPFVALPMAGKVFENPMVGLAFGAPWFDVYVGAVLDRENKAVNGKAQTTTAKWSFGFKISVSALAKALKGATSSSSK